MIYMFIYTYYCLLIYVPEIPTLSKTNLPTVHDAKSIQHKNSFLSTPP